MTEAEVIKRLRSHIEQAGGQRAFAEKHGFTPAYVSDVVRGKRGLAERILAAIGVERSIVYQEKEQLKSQDTAHEKGQENAERF